MKLTDAEWKIMHQVWGRECVSARQVLEAIEADTDWAYTTVKTLMNRLVDKGALEARISGNRSLYSPLVSPRRARAAAVADLVATAFGGAPAPAVQMMIEEEELEPAERQELRRRLEELDGPSDDSDGASER